MKLESYGCSILGSVQVTRAYAKVEASEAGVFQKTYGRLSLWPTALAAQSYWKLSTPSTKQFASKLMEKS